MKKILICPYCRVELDIYFDEEVVCENCKRVVNNKEIEKREVKDGRKINKS